MSKYLNTVVVSCGIACWCLLANCATTQSAREPSAQAVLQMRKSMAQTLVAQRYYDQALPYLTDLARQQPDDGEVRLLLGIVLREKGALQPAEAELKTARKLLGERASVHAAFGILYSKKGLWASGLSHLKKAVELEPKRASHHNDLAFCYLMLRKFSEAKESALAAIQLDPSMRRAYNNLGFVLGLNSDADGAMKAFMQAGSKAMALTNMGLVAQMRGNANEARDYYAQALRVDPGYKPAQHNLTALKQTAAVSTSDDDDDGARLKRPVESEDDE